MRALAVKGQSILLRTWTLRPDNAVEPVHHQNRTKRGSRANCQRWGALVCIDHCQVFCKDYSHPEILTSGDFHSDRSGGCLVPRWKSPDVVFSVRLGWTSPGVMVRVGFLFPCWCLDIAKIDKPPLTYSFHISIWGGRSPRNYPCGDGTGRMWDMKVNSSAAVKLTAQKLS